MVGRLFNQELKFSESIEKPKTQLFLHLQFWFFILVFSVWFFRGIVETHIQGKSGGQVSVDSEIAHSFPVKLDIFEIISTKQVEVGSDTDLAGELPVCLGLQHVSETAGTFSVCDTDGERVYLIANQKNQFMSQRCD
jgi:hypothetical protein